jgi:hypothetical protein
MRDARTPILVKGNNGKKIKRKGIKEKNHAQKR